jgi:hypothetical protein
MTSRIFARRKTRRSRKCHAAERARNDLARENVHAQKSTGARIPKRALAVVGQWTGHAFSVTHRESSNR